ncbi:MAG: hypothetical protein Q4F06_01045 [Eubacteriales bacterium]|nr:hypothetical protein [Eubacteriales bacterium]
MTCIVELQIPNPFPIPGIKLGLPTGNITGAVIIMLLIAVICSIIAVKFFRWE